MRKRARTDLCGGRSAMVVPTATTIPLAEGHISRIGRLSFRRPLRQWGAEAFRLSSPRR